MDDQQRWRLELKDSDAKVRAAAAENLCLAGSDSVTAAVELVVACGDVEDVQNWAASALEDLGAPSVDSVDALEPLVNSPKPLVGYWAATLLGRLGKTASRSQTILGKAVSDSPHLSVQERAAWALGKVGATEASVVESLKRAAASKSPRLASLATRALA
ncbi:HEAT repeat domain-containing protein [Mariniblastus sp.]|nr:HEAT repeat domain-containing protein [Mariniblastus sp.]MDA7903066.1 HEAT repeat domain-containing protein [Mariniblastus sp.]MDB4481037.1 HEAT repeat domain-containing protein [bacterium]